MEQVEIDFEFRTVDQTSERGIYAAYPSFTNTPRVRRYRNIIQSTFLVTGRFIALASGKRPRMREPDACPLLTSRHLLRPNRPLVPFAFLSLLRVSHGHRKLHPARPLVKHKQVPPRTDCLSRFVLPFPPLHPFFSPPLVLPYLCRTLTVPFNPLIRVKTNRVAPWFHLLSPTIVNLKRVIMSCYLSPYRISIIKIR